MFEDEFGGSAGSSVFPFLSVLICTMGVMVVLMISCSLKMDTKAMEKNVAADFDVVEEVNAKKVKLAALVAKRSKYEDAAKKGTWKTKTEDTMERKEGLDVKVDSEMVSAEKLTRDVDGAKRTFDTVRSEGVARKRDLRRIEALVKKGENQEAFDVASARKKDLDKTLPEAKRKAAELGAQKADLTLKRDDLRKRQEKPEARFTFKGEGADRRPVIIALRGDGLKVIESDRKSAQEDEVIPLEDAQAFLEKLAADLAGSENPSYALFLHRPDALKTYRVAKRAFFNQRATSRYEAVPIEARWFPKFGLEP